MPPFPYPSAGGLDSSHQTKPSGSASAKFEPGLRRRGAATITSRTVAPPSDVLQQLLKSSVAGSRDLKSTAIDCSLLRVSCCTGLRLLHVDETRPGPTSTVNNAANSAVL